MHYSMPYLSRTFHLQRFICAHGTVHWTQVEILSEIIPELKEIKVITIVLRTFMFPRIISLASVCFSSSIASLLSLPPIALSAYNSWHFAFCTKHFFFPLSPWPPSPNRYSDLLIESILSRSFASPFHFLPSSLRTYNIIVSHRSWSSDISPPRIYLDVLQSALNDPHTKFSCMRFFYFHPQIYPLCVSQRAYLPM